MAQDPTAPSSPAGSRAGRPPAGDQGKDPVISHRFAGSELEELKAYGRIHAHEAGAVLFDEGALHPDCCVVLSGQLNVYIFEGGEERRVGWLEPGQFTGDVSLITGQPSLALARMDIPGEVLHIDRENFQRLLVENSTLSDIFVNVLVARRAWARVNRRASVLLIGRAYDHDTFAIRDLLDKHAVAHLFVNLDTDENADIMLEKQA
ncbi:MAG: Crp/Fnr family transcriptional regulator [Alphaproteobacteria bacterium]